MYLVLTPTWYFDHVTVLFEDFLSADWLDGEFPVDTESGSRQSNPVRQIFHVMLSLRHEAKDTELSMLAASHPRLPARPLPRSPRTGGRALPQ